LEQFSSIDELKILVHGGGKLATALAEKLGVVQTMVEGRRITDADTLKITTMVYSGFINKQLTARLQQLGCNAIGLSGADANLISTKKRNHPFIDYGFAGDIHSKSIDPKTIAFFLENKFVLVINPITHDGNGQLLNTNADTIAAAIAIACAGIYQCRLTYCFEKKGVLTEIDKEASCLPVLNKATYLKLKENGTINKGMLPKLDNAFEAMEKGVQQVRICNAANILERQIGTQINL
jgi:acetylglutamate kinase